MPTALGRITSFSAYLDDTTTLDEALRAVAALGDPHVAEEAAAAPLD